MSHVVVVGASVAGVKFVQNLRAEGFDGQVTLVDLEHEPLYDKPPLSKTYLHGEGAAAKIALVTPEELERLDIRTRFGAAATCLDPASRKVHLEDGSEIAYDMVVIATGARARRTPWASLPGVHVLRTRADADGLRSALRTASSLVVIGAGFIGAEVAATARRAGIRVTIIEPVGAPMARAMNHEVGAIFADKHRREGVDLRFGVSVDDIAPSGDHLRLVLTDGSTIVADAVLLGIGAVVNTEWLESSGIPIENGVMCDASLAVSGFQDVYAIGDVARFANERHPESVRLEHWTNAVDQGLVLAHNLLHPAGLRHYDPIEHVWTDQYDWKIQIVGRTGATDWSLVGDPVTGRFAVAYSSLQGRLDGVIVVNWPRALIDARRCVAVGGSTSDFLDRLETLGSSSKAAT